MLSIKTRFRKITSKTFKNTVRYENMLVQKKNKIKRNQSTIFCFFQQQQQPSEPKLDTIKDNEPIIEKNDLIRKLFFWNKNKSTSNLTNLLALSQFQIDDHVNIDFDFDAVQKLQVGHGGWCEAMFEVLQSSLFVYITIYFFDIRDYFIFFSSRSELLVL